MPSSFRLSVFQLMQSLVSMPVITCKIIITKIQNAHIQTRFILGTIVVNRKLQDDLLFAGFDYTCFDDNVDSYIYVNALIHMNHHYAAQSASHVYNRSKIQTAASSFLASWC